MTNAERRLLIALAKFVFVLEDVVDDPRMKEIYDLLAEVEYEDIFRDLESGD